MGWSLCHAGFLEKKEKTQEKRKEKRNSGEYSDTSLFLPLSLLPSYLSPSPPLCLSVSLFSFLFLSAILFRFHWSLLYARLIRSRAYDAVNVPLWMTLGVGRFGNYQHFPGPFQWDFNWVLSKEHDGSVSIQYPTQERTNDFSRWLFLITFHWSAILLDCYLISDWDSVGFHYFRLITSCSTLINASVFSITRTQRN